MYENRINLSIKPNFKTFQPQCAQIVTIGNYSYNPCDSIGLGYISNVFLGQNNTTLQKVAIKVIDTSNKDHLVLQFLKSEIQILRKINTYGCKHLLKLEETFNIDNKIYIVTQFCEGKDLAKTLRQQKMFSDKDAQTIMKQILRTYEDVYELGIVHRDLKLSNLLVKNGTIKLADFGFAVPIVNCIEEFPYNAGSPYYMPPESLKRNRFSFKSDIWALGVMAYELVFGKLPYREKVQSLQYDALMQQSIQEKLSTSNLSQAYRSFIIACMQKDMRKRASPEFVINYQWPQAESQLPKCFNKPQLSQNQALHLPQGNQNHIISQSIKLNRQQTAEDHISANTLKYTSSSSLLQTERPKISQFDLSSTSSSSQISFKKPHLTQAPFLGGAIPAQRTLIRSEKSMIQITSNPVFFSKTQRRMAQNVDISEQFKRNQQIVVCITYYCKFLFNLYTILEQDNYVPEGNLLKIQIGKKIMDNYSELQKFIHGQSSKFGFMTAFTQFLQTECYHRLKDILRLDKYCLSSKLHFNREYLPYNPQILSNAIKYLAHRIPSRFALTEQLCHYYCLRQLQFRGIQQFIAHSKIQSLARNFPSNKIVTDVECKQLQCWASKLVR